MILRTTAKLVKHRLSQMTMLNGKEKNQTGIVFSQRKKLLFDF